MPRCQCQQCNFNMSSTRLAIQLPAEMGWLPSSNRAHLRREDALTAFDYHAHCWLSMSAVHWPAIQPGRMRVLVAFAAGIDCNQAPASARMSSFSLAFCANSARTRSVQPFNRVLSIPAIASVWPTSQPRKANAVSRFSMSHLLCG